MARRSRCRRSSRWTDVRLTVDPTYRADADAVADLFVLPVALLCLLSENLNARRAGISVIHFLAAWA
jgi:hypothetical protein